MIYLRNAQMTMEVREGTDCLLVALNLDNAASVLPAPNMRVVVAGGGALRRAGTAEAQISLAPHGWTVLSGVEDG